MADNLSLEDNPLYLNYGIENYPEYMATQSNSLMANQAGFLNFLQNGNVQGNNELTMNMYNCLMQISRG